MTFDPQAYADKHEGSHADPSVVLVAAFHPEAPDAGVVVQTKRCGVLVQRGEQLIVFSDGTRLDPRPTAPAEPTAGPDPAPTEPAKPVKQKWKKTKP